MDVLLLNMMMIFHIFLVVGGAWSAQACSPVRCGNSGPEIRFPFWLKDQQLESCGYPSPEFMLSCSPNNLTELNFQSSVKASTINNVSAVLPFSSKFIVNEILYKSQKLNGRFTGGPCLPKQLPVPAADSNVSLSQTLNMNIDPNDNYERYTLFNCSSSSSSSSNYILESGCVVDCLNLLPGYQVMAFDSHNLVSEFIFPSCVKMYSISDVPWSIMYSTTKYELATLVWSKPSCKGCEAKGKYCMPKATDNARTQCVHHPGQHSKQQGVIYHRVEFSVVPLSILLVLSILLYYILSWKRRKDQERKIEKFLEDYAALRPTRFTYTDIKKITERFKEKLGQGGYGTVYKGKLSNDVLVAVKVLKISKGNGAEFINEVGTIGKIHHVNVVRLVGYCSDGYNRALVYEFLPNDSLEKVIFSRKKITEIGRQKLHEIAIGVAKGLDYLHQGCNQRILHFDIKPQNILLDHHFNPKVADFGLAKLCSKEQSVVFMTAARGTVGYIAPEIFSRNFGSVSYKSDVYSFGMLMLDMVGGQTRFQRARNHNSNNEIYFPEWMYNQLQKGGQIAIQIDEEEDGVIFMRLAIVGLWCIQWYPADRPSMKDVLQMLEGENMPIMPPNPFASTTTATDTC